MLQVGKKKEDYHIRMHGQQSVIKSDESISQFCGHAQSVMHEGSLREVK